MKIWQDIESQADENGFIPEKLYNENASNFKVCPPKDPDIQRMETQLWEEYLSSTRRNNKKRMMYEEMYRYEWYEGRKRMGFWGNIEDAVRTIDIGESPKVTIFSAGSGRDLFKVCLSSGIWKSKAPQKIKGTHREVSTKYFTLNKPNAKIMATEYDQNNLLALRSTINELIKEGLLNKGMIATRKWDFREAAPVASETQDLVIFSLTGNYATKIEQPLILQEIARCIGRGGYFVASTMTDKFSFKVTTLKKLKFLFSSPLIWPIMTDFFPWQARYAKMAAMMNEKGYWKNFSADKWMEFLLPSNMEKVKIYPGPSKLVPVEVLVARKKLQAES